MKYDLIVIGGGPAGMIAAAGAGENGAQVLLVEKNPRLGNKLLITGKGRCNITNKIENVRDLVSYFGSEGKFLYSAFSSFGVVEVIDFFEKRGLELKTERGGRVFPVSDKSSDVLDVLLRYLEESKVKIKTNTQVKKINKKEGEITNIELLSGETMEAEKYLIATGGKSYPGTGSSGDGYSWARDLGHKVVNPIPSLSPIILKEEFVKELEGLSLKNVEISLFKNKKKIDSRFGEALFTSDGMSGPIILDMSKKMKQEEDGVLILKIDFKPALDFQELEKRILGDFREMSNKMFKNSLDKLLPQKLIPIIIRLSGVDAEKKVNAITRGERRKVIHLIKEFELEYKELFGFNKAIITAGGVDLSEINPQTMQSKIIKNLFFAGEVLNIDGPTGGFNLQVSWSTGFLVANNFKKYE